MRNNASKCVEVTVFMLLRDVASNSSVLFNEEKKKIRRKFEKKI